MRRRHESATGVINLPRRNFEDVLRHHVRNEEDYKAMLTAFYNYVGHRNTFPQTSTDELLAKALALNQPELAFDLIGYHAELLIHPSPKLLRSFLNSVLATRDYEKLKAFFEVTKGRFFLRRPANLNRTVIEQAYENDDKETVVAAYLDILDYDKELEGADAALFTKVLESMTYEEAIDHVLFGHVQEQMKARGFDCRLYNAVYYINSNGGLTASDILNELSSDSSITSLPNSALFKAELVEKIVGDENPLKLDADVLEQAQLALKTCKGKLDTEFYECGDFLGVSPPVETAEEETPVDVPAEEASEEAAA